MPISNERLSIFAEFAKGQKRKQTQWGQQPLVCAYNIQPTKPIQYSIDIICLSLSLVLALALFSDTLAYTRSNAAQHALFSMPLSLILALIQEEPRSIPRKDCIVENWLGHIILITSGLWAPGCVALTQDMPTKKGILGLQGRALYYIV